MDGSHFDTLVKTLATTRLTRVQTLRGLVASGVAALTGITRGSEAAVAKKNHEKKVKICKCPDANAANCRSAKVKKSRAKKQARKACNYKGACRAGVTSCGTQTLSGCTPNCDRKVCGPDGCGGRCGTCGAELVCANGQCASSCPGGQKVCNGDCIPNNQCCTGSDCPAASPTCCGGACVNVQFDARNCGRCGAACGLNEQCVSGGCRCTSVACGATCCPPGTTRCLSNGSCARQCDPTNQSTCPSGCECNFVTNTEGQGPHCVTSGQSCSPLMTCTPPPGPGTSGCPIGTECEECSSLTDFRCVQLCTV
jgi:hypothetical protein